MINHQIVDYRGKHICTHAGQSEYEIVAVEVPRMKYEVRKSRYPENFIIKIINYYFFI